MPAWYHKERVPQPRIGRSGVPLYEYECCHCHHRFEKIESYSAPEKQKCPKCGKVANRVLAPSAIQFKGTGWYVTDYAGKNPGAKTGTESGSTGDGAAAKPKKADATGTSKKE
jgi:putative FmdB family regulatory protein